MAAKQFWARSEGSFPSFRRRPESSLFKLSENLDAGFRRHDDSWDRLNYDQSTSGTGNSIEKEALWN